MRCEPGMQENKNFTRFSFLKWSRQASAGSPVHTAEPAMVPMIKQQSRSQQLVCSSQFLVLKKSAFCFIFYFLGFASSLSRGRCTHCSHLELVFDLTILFQKTFFIVFRNSTTARMHFPFSAPSRMHFNRESHIQENITAPAYLLFNLVQNSHVIIGVFIFIAFTVDCFMFSKLAVFPQKIFIILQGAYFIDARMDTIIRFIS